MLTVLEQRENSKGSPPYKRKLSPPRSRPQYCRRPISPTYRSSTKPPVAHDVKCSGTLYKAGSSSSQPTRKAMARGIVDVHRRRMSNPTEILKKNSKNARTSEDTFFASSIYSTSNTDFNTKMHGHFQTSAMDSSLKVMELVAQSVKTFIRPSRILFLSDSKPTQSP